MHSEGVTDRETQRAELDRLRSEWREALLAAREALRAEEGVLPDEELASHERHLRDEYGAAAAQLRRFALDEGLPTELAEPFLPRGPRPPRARTSAVGSLLRVRAGRGARRERRPAPGSVGENAGRAARGPLRDELRPPERAVQSASGLPGAHRGPATARGCARLPGQSRHSPGRGRAVRSSRSGDGARARQPQERVARPVARAARGRSVRRRPPLLRAGTRRRHQLRGRLGERSHRRDAPS